MTASPRDDFHDEMAASLTHNRITRRQALWLLGAGSSAVALQGCAYSPVTGEPILVGMSEAQERSTDTQLAPHQFSQDLGEVQDPALNRYVSDVGNRLARRSHRPTMPYSYRTLNANYVNAYTFPGGAMGLTRGIVSDLDNEAELAALLGHEIAHVNARHAAQRQGQGLLLQVASAGLNIAASGTQWSTLAGLGSAIGSSALLANYSRENEREADALGQEYMVRAGYPANGMVSLHQKLLAEEKSQPNLLATLFSTHPMSRERVANAQSLANGRYAVSRGASPGRERFMDQTASLRRLKPTIDACKQGETAMAKKNLTAAHSAFQTALARTPQDYAANVRMAQCLQAQGRASQAKRFIDTAQRINPREAYAQKVGATLALALRDPGSAYAQLDRYDRLLPGDPGVLFLKGVSAEGMGDRQRAANHYASYLRRTQSGDAAQFAYQRLQRMGMVR